MITEKYRHDQEETVWKMGHSASKFELGLQYCVCVNMSLSAEVVRLPAAPRIQQPMDGRIMRCGINSLRQSAVRDSLR